MQPKVNQSVILFPRTVAASESSVTFCHKIPAGRNCQSRHNFKLMALKDCIVKPVTNLSQGLSTGGVIVCLSNSP